MSQSIESPLGFFSPVGNGAFVRPIAARTLLRVVTGMELMPFVIISC